MSKILPSSVPATHRPFWDALKAHAVQVQRCDECGRHRHIPKDICPGCHSERSTWAPISGRGAVYSYTVVHRAPTPAYQQEAPYVLAHVTMEEGFRMFARLTTGDLGAVRIGMPVKVAFDDVTPEWTLLIFEPDDEPVTVG